MEQHNNEDKKITQITTNKKIITIRENYDKINFDVPNRVSLITLNHHHQNDQQVQFFF